MSLADPPPVLAVAPTAAPLVDPLFISDLHLAAERPRTIARFLRFLAEDAPGHRELVILGDLFEFWIGDDAAAVRATHRRRDSPRTRPAAGACC